MFYDKLAYLTTKTVTTNDIGQEIESYRKGVEIYCDVQPIDEKALKYTWGNDVKSNISMYSDENLKINDVVMYNNKTYRIEKKIAWDDYNIYALLEKDAKISI